MNQAIVAERSRSEIIRLCHTNLDSRTLRTELLQRLQSIVPFNYAYFTTTDPATQLGTSTILAEAPPHWMMALFIENEYLQTDFNKFSDMLKTNQTVSVLSEATRNELHRSVRYREMLLPIKMEDEVRAVFVSGAACWGVLCLHRETHYNPAEAAFLVQVAPHIAEGLRKSMLSDGTTFTKMSDGPGVLLLADDLSVVATTAAAEYWLAELADANQGRTYGLPVAVRSVVAGLRAIERGLVEPDFMPKLRLRTRSGHWLVLHAARLRNSDSQGQITVVFEMAQPAEIAPLIMQAFQFTKREGEIVQCVLRGWTTTEIAARLSISSNTVQDHLKAIFEKADVGSRGELAARFLKLPNYGGK